VVTDVVRKGNKRLRRLIKRYRSESIVARGISPLDYLLSALWKIGRKEASLSK